MKNPSAVTAVVVTGGNKDISEVVASLSGFGEVIVWNNSAKLANRMVFGRYLAAREARNETVYVQDDDCVVDSAAVCAAHVPGALVANMPQSRRAEYVRRRVSLVGWGAIFDKSLLDFTAYWKSYPLDELFERECDRVFTRLVSDVRWIDVPFRNMDYAHDADRMGMESRHRSDLKEILLRLDNLHGKRVTG